MNIAECVGDNQNCSLLPSCALKSAFAEARRSFLATLETYRLSDMLRGKVPAANVAVARLPEKMSAKLNSLAKRSEEHTSELQSLMRISYAVFCLKKKTT